MRARKEERNQYVWEQYRKGRTQKEIAKELGLSQGRVCKIYNNQDRWNAEKNSERRRNPDELPQYIKEKR